MLLSSKTDLSPFFEGHAFSDIDLIVDQEGMDKFLSEGKIFESDEDGNYVRGYFSSKNTFEIETDYRGYYPIFYYTHGKYWCISDSFKELVEKISKDSMPLIFKEHSIDAWKNSSALYVQTTSDENLFKNIISLASNEKICLSIDKKEIKFSIQNKLRKKNNYSYNYNLENLIRIWIGRVKSMLLSDEMTISCDLTGGLDSRVVFSLIENSSRHDNLKQLVRIVSQKDKADDYKIAEYICRTYGFDIENRLGDIKKEKGYCSVPLSAHESYDEWYRNNLGRYSANILPFYKKSDFCLNMGGVGGESFRPFYIKNLNTNSIDEFNRVLHHKKENFRSQHYFFEWKEEVLNSAIVASSRYSDIDDVSIAHYREYRERHHFNKNHRNELSAAFLGSKYFYITAYSAPNGYMDNGQVLYDVMYNLNKELPFIAYDELSKRIDGQNVINLFYLNIGSPIEAGKIYKAKKEIISKKQTDKRNPNDILFDKAERILLSNKRHDLMSEEFTKESLISIQEFRKNSRKNRHSNGSFLHYVMLCDFISKFA